MKDKVKIFCSPLGMYSMLRGDYIISVIDDDGSLNETKLNKMLAGIATMGANCLRDFFWINSAKADEFLAPFHSCADGSYTFNDKYFADQKRIAEICNQYGIRYYVCLFDHCGTRVPGVREWNPWRHFRDFFYGEDAKELRHKYIEKLLLELEGLDIGVEICNEPKGGQGEFLADTFLYLYEKNVDSLQTTPGKQKIILGNDYYLKEKYNDTFGKDYRVFRNLVMTKLGDDWSKKIKTNCISPVHNANLNRIHHLWGNEVKPGGERVILYSMDGLSKPRPTKEEMYAIAKEVFETKNKAREQEKVHFEVIFGKQEPDATDSVIGVLEAYKEIWGTYTNNYEKFPEVLPLEQSKESPDSTVLQTEEIKDSPEEKEEKPVPEPAPAPMPTPKPAPKPAPTPPSEKENNSIEAQVIHGYKAILGRKPDKTGRKTYIDFLESGKTLIEFCRVLLASEEFKKKNPEIKPEKLARQIYRGILLRKPDESGMKNAVKLIKKGKIAELTVGMLTSKEFLDTLTN